MVDRVVLRIDIELPRAVGGFRRRALARDDEVVVAPHAQFFHLQFRDQHFAREHFHEQPFEVRHARFERAVRVRDNRNFAERSIRPRRELVPGQEVGIGDLRPRGIVGVAQQRDVDLREGSAALHVGHVERFGSVERQQAAADDLDGHIFRRSIGACVDGGRARRSAYVRVADALAAV